MTCIHRNTDSLLSDRQTQFGFRYLYDAWTENMVEREITVKKAHFPNEQVQIVEQTVDRVYEFITLIERNKAPSTGQMATKSRASAGRSGVCMCVLWRGREWCIGMGWGASLAFYVVHAARYKELIYQPLSCSPQQSNTSKTVTKCLLTSFCITSGKPQES